MAPLTILDAGAHDGFVGAWLRERFDGELILDGLELMPDAAQRARERGYREVAVAPAEAAADHFEPESYDCAVCFEVLEHVPDMGVLLDSLERMVKPDTGRVLLSTPDGAFGTGGNPHHLRALRAIDLFDLIRRRGELHDQLVGPDGVSVVSYTPGPRRGEIAIYTGPSWMGWHPKDIEQTGLGGSETAAVRLAEHLSCLGFVVTIYGEFSEQGGWRDILLRHHSTFDPLERRLAVISSRIPELFDRPVAARARLLWLHDTDCGPRLTPTRADRIDHVLCLSEWHERHVRGLYPFLDGKLIRTRNGIEPAYFEPKPEAGNLGSDGADPSDVGYRAKRVLYTSSPDRGLDVLLELWPQVRERVPDAELMWGYSPVYWSVAAQDPTVGAHAEKVKALSKQPGVVSFDSLSQPELAKLMLDSLVWCAPSYNTPHDIPFHETSCIGAMEAQAAGCHVVASNWGALPETVKVGALIDGPALSEKWKAAFVNEIVRGLVDPATQEHAQREGPLAARDLSWQGVADQVAKLVEETACVPASA